MTVTADNAIEQAAQRLAILPTRQERGAMMEQLKRRHGRSAAWQIRERALALRRRMGQHQELPRAARRSDPQPSHEAAAEVTASGQRTGNMRTVAAAVAQYPGHTTRELHALGRLGTMDLHTAGRRMSDAVRDGWVVKGESRRCTVGNRKATAFWPPHTHH